MKAPNTLTFQGENKSTQAIAEEMNYRDYKTIDYKGRYALLKVAESNITLTRKAKPKVNDSSGKRLKPQTGEPLELRLICTRIEDKEGRLLASWYLLSNTQLSAEVLAQYYHYRWQIESYFKLLKSAGHHMENWLQQRTGSVIVERSISYTLVYSASASALRSDGFSNHFSMFSTRRAIVRASP